MAQVDMAVAVEVDAVLDVGARQKLRLADLAGVGAYEIAQRQVAALQDLQGRDELVLEQLGAPAIMCERRQRAHNRHLADIAAAVVAFSSVQIAITTTAGGTPNCRSMRDSNCAWRCIRLCARLMRGGITRVAAYSSKLLL